MLAASSGSAWGLIFLFLVLAVIVRLSTVARLEGLLTLVLLVVAGRWLHLSTSPLELPFAYVAFFLLGGAVIAGSAWGAAQRRKVEPLSWPARGAYLLAGWGAGLGALAVFALGIHLVILIPLVVTGSVEPGSWTPILIALAIETFLVALLFVARRWVRHRALVFEAGKPELESATLGTDERGESERSDS